MSDSKVVEYIDTQLKVLRGFKGKACSSQSVMDVLWSIKMLIQEGEK